MTAIDSIADAVSGGIVARAVEPATGLDTAGHTTEQRCLNCGTALVGSYCHDCGQKGHVHRTLHAFAHDLLHGVLHFEGKIFRTLPKLLFKPGELTRRYIAGERARFVSPLALFLFSVFTMFAVMGLLGSPLDSLGQEQATSEVRAEAARLDSSLANLRLQRDTLAARGGDVTALNNDIREAQIARDLLGAAGAPTPLPTASGKAAASDPRPAGQAQLSFDREESSPTTTVNVAGAKVIGFQPKSAFDKAYRAAKANPKLLIYKVQTNAYKFSWALIILSVPFMALLFLWRWRPLYDHAVFVTYSITAASIVAILGSLLVLAGVPADPVLTAATLFLPWHMYRQLRGGYGLTRLSALWRTVALVIFANLALSLFALGLLMLGVIG
jgi:hypothetical protein